MQVLTCAITRDGKKVVSGSYDKTLKVWDMESGIELFTLRGHTSFVILSFCFPALLFSLIITTWILLLTLHRFSRVASLEMGRKLCQDHIITHQRCGTWNLESNYLFSQPRYKTKPNKQKQTKTNKNKQKQTKINRNKNKTKQYKKNKRKRLIHN